MASGDCSHSYSGGENRRFFYFPNIKICLAVTKMLTILPEAANRVTIFRSAAVGICLTNT